MRRFATGLLMVLAMTVLTSCFIEGPVPYTTRPFIVPGAGTGRGKAARAGTMAAGVRGSASIMKATTGARVIVARGSGMRDTARILVLVPGAY